MFVGFVSKKLRHLVSVYLYRNYTKYKKGNKVRTHNKFAKLLATVALCIATTGFAGNGLAAGFKVIIDCHGDDGYPTWSESGGPITIKAYVNGAWVTVASNFSISNAQCIVEDGVTKSYPAFSWDVVEKLKITNDGNDALFMDRVFLADSDGVQKVYWGIDNNIGYCLSQQEEGPETWAYCWNTRFYTGITFLR